jgi:hypothetical protein
MGPRELTERTIVNQQRGFRLAEHVYKSGRNHPSRGIDDFLSPRIVKFPDCRDAIFANCNIGGIPRPSGAVQNVAIPYNQVIFAIILLACLRAYPRRRVKPSNRCQKRHNNDGPFPFHRFSVKSIVSNEIMNLWSSVIYFPRQPVRPLA